MPLLWDIHGDFLNTILPSSHLLEHWMTLHCWFPTNPPAALSPEFISQPYLLPCTSGGTKLVLTLWPQHKLFPIYMTLSALSCLDPYLPVGHNLDIMDLWLFYSKSLPTYFDRILYEIIYSPGDFVFCHGEYEFLKENCTILYSRDPT